MISASLTVNYSLCCITYVYLYIVLHYLQQNQSSDVKIYVFLKFITIMLLNVFTGEIVF